MGSKNQAIGLTKDGHNSKLTAAVDEAGHVVPLLLFPGQCAETTEAKKLLPLLAKTMIFVGDKGFDSDGLRQLIEDNGGLASKWPDFRIHPTYASRRRQFTEFFSVPLHSTIC